MINIKENILTVFAESTVRSLLNGTRTPSLKSALLIKDKCGIPVEAWRDIKSFMSHHNAKNQQLQDVS
jgi:hypothetical protein